MALIKCPECKETMSDSLKSCPHCGYKEKKKIKIHLNSKQKKWIGIGFASMIAVIVITLIVVNVNNNPVDKYISYLQKGKYEEASKVYEKNIKENGKKETAVKNKLYSEIKSKTDDYTYKKIEYNDVKSSLIRLGQCALVSTQSNNALAEIEKLKTSRDAYDKAETSSNDKKYYDAILQYRNVIQSDENYSNAQTNIDVLASEYKKEVLASVETYQSAENYSSALSLLQKALSVKVGDDDLINKSTEIKSLKENQDAAKEAAKIESAMNSQKVSVTGNPYIRIQSDTYKSLYPDLLVAQVINNTDKTIKSYTIAFVGFDNNGYPVKYEWANTFRDSSYENTGVNDNCNLAPGAMSNIAGGWDLDHDYSGKIATLKACVKSATFYDNTTWTNEYYTYWNKQYNGKPLQ